MSMPDEPTSDDPTSKSQNTETPSDGTPDEIVEETSENVSSDEVVDDIARERGDEEIVQAKDDGDTEHESTTESVESTVTEETTEHEETSVKEEATEQEEATESEEATEQEETSVKEEVTESEETIVGSPIEIVGEMLRSAREAKRFSTADVARELMITQTFVDAIEQAIVERLPNRVYVRGYLASYADYVEAPKDQVLELFDKSFEGLETERSKRPASIRGIKRKANVKSFLSKNSPKILTALIIATIIGISSVIWYFWTSDAAVPANLLPEIPSAGLDQSAQVRQDGSTLLKESYADIRDNEETDSRFSVLGDGESNVIAIGNADLLEENPLNQLDIPEDTDTVLGRAPLITVEDRTSPDDRTEPPDVADGVKLPEVDDGMTTDEDLDTPLENALALSEHEAKLQHARAEGLPIGSLLIELKEECWIEVEDRYGDRIYNDLHHPNDTVLLSGVTPLKVTLGNARGATLYYNGEEVELRPSVGTGGAQVSLR